MNSQPITQIKYSAWNRYRLARQSNRALLHFLGIFFSIACFLPFVVSISASLTDEKALGKNGYQLLPSEWSTYAYSLLFRSPDDLLRSYGVTFFVAIAGTLLSLLVMAPFAYALSRKGFVLRRFFSLYIFITMVFHGGLVPWYILIKQYLQLDNTVWVMIVPFLVNAWMIIILRSNFATLPQEILDAARIDGAGEWRILIQIATPMTAPSLAAMGIFTALGFWNTYYPALLFIREQTLYPLQYMLYVIQSNMEIFRANPELVGIPIPTVSLRYAMVVLIGLPILIFTLYFQRYFVKGVYLGGMKE
jgi:putative aldouronate transport system permease protein